MNETPEFDGCSAWNPGVRPEIPEEFRLLETIFQSECVTTGFDEVAEFSRLTGLGCEELVAFRPQRLALHEVIIRVTAEVAIVEGESEEALGQNFRRIAGRVWNKYIVPTMDSIESTYAELWREVEASVTRILCESLMLPEATPVRRRFSFSLAFGRQLPTAERVESIPERAQRIVAEFKAVGLTAENPLQRSIFRSLNRILSALIGANGYIGSDSVLLVQLVTRHVCNHYGGQLIGEGIAPLIDAAIQREGYVPVCTQQAPILFSLKGASAAGKSSLRPMLIQLMRDQGIAPDGYMTVSPDIWRRLLLDYESLGPARKYAGYLTSREVAVIDAKLDRYIRKKADRCQAIPHVMVDRFRFDSFSSERIKRVIDGTYAKYAETIYMYFIITPPEETVERGWHRALERGRFKAVEDFLGHCVEAYVGMPRILFKWLGYRQPDYRYFFMDNRVPKGTFPRTSALGDRNTMTIYEPRIFVDIERYQKIDIHATSPTAVYPPARVTAVANNLGFLKACMRKIPQLNFVSSSDNVCYLRITNGKHEILNEEIFDKVMVDTETAEIIGHFLPGGSLHPAPIVSLQ